MRELIESATAALPNHLPEAIACCVLGVALIRLATGRKRNNEPGRRVVVTGAASGIGKEVTRILAEKGYRIWACDLDAKGLSYWDAVPNITTVKLDVRDAKACEELAGKVGEDGGSLDGLINVAGVAQSGPATGFSEEQVRFLFDINTFAPMRLSRLMIPVMLRTPRGGSIINVTSVGGRVSWPWSGVYSPSKAALNLFSDSLRRESMANNLPLRVSIIAPGPVDTPLVDAFIEKLRSWAEANASNPFAPGVKREADFQSDLVKLGMGTSSVSVTPQKVAAVIVDALEDPNPRSYYLIATLTFKCVYYLALMLPTCLGDKLLIAM